MEAQKLAEKLFFWTQEDIERLPPLPLPIEIFEPEPEKPVRLRIERWELYKTIIHPKRAGAPEEKLVLVLRVYLFPEFRSPRAPYYDITSGHLIRTLVPFLQQPDYQSYIFTIIKHGRAPKAYYEIIPERVTE